MRITALTPSPRNPRRVSVRVEGKPVATLGARLVEELGLTVGQAWDETVAGQIAAAVAYDKTLRDATRMVNRRMLSRRRLGEQLVSRGHAQALVDRALDRLEELGALDDEALGRELIRQLTTRKPAGAALLRARLSRRGLSESLIDRLVTEPVDENDALALARQQLDKLAGLDTGTKARRIAGLLARRGFDEDTVTRTLSTLGLAHQPDAFEP